ncbi:group II intron reverse transcriptase/maturase [Rummeliibacillus stabekisii]|uniref:group II intron reverse transcriptase/maturase n=1 Tax=Rummeliibacillus stabekisii TaxID=241244 RepID=UPI0037243BDB
MQTTLRKWEYYNLTDTFSELYDRSSKGENFHNLYDLIISKENILLAYRSIKTNKGSQTPGTDRITIGKYKNLKQSEFISLIREKLRNYHPKAVKRVMIPKSNGDKRPLGIPAMIDRIIQQMFKQILEPIAEAKFYKHSYGFRPLRGAHHAKARIDFLVNRSQYHYTVDIDIKGFFDNVNHTVLNKQLWNMGIRDKRVLVIIGKMLKTPIKGEGIPTKGTPQGGILSPLLANIYLNDLDQWVVGQWEDFPLHKPPKLFRDAYRTKHKTKLKHGFIVRYADDFKILCKDSDTAWKWYHAVKNYLNKRLKLEISPDKSKVVNLRKRHTEFLGFKIKAIKKGNKYVNVSRVTDKKKKEIAKNIRTKVVQLQKYPDKVNIRDINSVILGAQNYFKYASHVYLDFDEIAFKLSRTLYNRFKGIASYGYPTTQNNTYLKYYGHLHRKTYSIGSDTLFPIVGVKHQSNMNFNQQQTPYTIEGRRIISNKLDGDIEKEIIKLMKSEPGQRSMEYMDNRLSRYSMRKGKCEISGVFLNADEVHCHHYNPIRLGGDDSYNNLRIIDKTIHRLIHATDPSKIEKYISITNLTTSEINKVNRYRKACKLELI